MSPRSEHSGGESSGLQGSGGEQVSGAVKPAASLVDEAVYRPVRSGNSLEDTVARLMQTIRLGVVSPGQTLPSERDLAVRFSVSRDTVREAIRELADAGYLASRRGRYGGTFVSDPLPEPPARPAVLPTAAELDDILGLRAMSGIDAGTCRAIGLVVIAVIVCGTVLLAVRDD